MTHPKILWPEEIAPHLTFDHLIPALERGFRDFFEGRAKNAPVSNLALPDVNGEMHVKPGYIAGGDYICVKIATCFYDNPSRGMPTRDGVLVLANRTNGRIEAIIYDAGLVTDMRTAGSSAVAAGALAIPDAVELGLVGTGTQSYWHALALRHVRPLKKILIWGRRSAAVEAACHRVRVATGLQAEAATLSEVAACQIIVTATPASEAVLTDQKLRPGALVVAMGSDAVGKRELGPTILEQASTIVADSLDQCRRLGEMQWLPQGASQRITELGAILTGAEPARHAASDIIIFDSTGVAFQDVVGASAILSREPAG